jgi:hypothetical protein
MESVVHGAVRPTYSTLAWMEVMTYSLLTLALMKIFAADGSQHFGGGLDGPPSGT